MSSNTNREPHPALQPYGTFPGPNMELTETALLEVLPHVGASFVYNLYVHPRQTVAARRLLRQLQALYVENPFSPYINLNLNPFLERGEWYLENPDDDLRVGCKGF